MEEDEVEEVVVSGVHDAGGAPAGLGEGGASALVTPTRLSSAFMTPSAVKHDPDKNIFLNTVCDDIVFYEWVFLRLWHLRQ